MISRRFGTWLGLSAAITLALSAPAMAQTAHDHMQHGAMQHDHIQRQPKNAAKKTVAKKRVRKPMSHARHHGGAHTMHPHQHHAHQTAAAPALAHMGHQHGAGGAPMQSPYGPYPSTRDASGTSWQPQSTPHEGAHFMVDDWMLMAHGTVYGVYDRQSGPRGGQKGFAAGMLMGMAQRPVGADGTLSFRAMMSPDPFMGPRGYPLLFATGETANGLDHLVDRQHPHDLFAELSAAYSHRLGPVTSAFLYVGLPGEPALGPPTFMHRFSSGDSPVAPISHHWLDSTHVTFGVVTAGLIHDNLKLEASAFRGREPDQFRYNIERPKLDSFSTRLTFNPTENWSLQASFGHIKSGEQLAPDVNEDRLTLSAIYNRRFGETNWATTFAYGRKMNHPGRTLNAFLIESALTFNNAHTFFARGERVDEDELLESPFAGFKPVYTVHKASLGYIYDLRVAEHLKLGLGGVLMHDFAPKPLRPWYGGGPNSFMGFVRLKLM
ncbi:MAG: hypothetical protein KGL46_08915 [Hyphomicrobiales bacterium]|nr:hypothetical protein [Hyphomicrobiales bacterium]